MGSWPRLCYRRPVIQGARSLVTDRPIVVAGAGAIVGGILGGVKGAILGAVIGAGGAIAATEGKDIELPAGSIIRIRLDAPMNVR